MKSIKYLNSKMTAKYTRIITYTSKSDIYFGNLSEKIDDLILKTKKKEIEEKFK